MHGGRRPAGVPSTPPRRHVVPARARRSPRRASEPAPLLPSCACAQPGVRVVSASYGGMGAYSSMERTAIQALGDAGILFVASAGNGERARPAVLAPARGRSGAWHGAALTVRPTIPQQLQTTTTQT